MKLKRIAAIALLGLSPLGGQAADCYSYEPVKSHVPGTLDARPLDPNNPDSREVLMLKLDAPICVEGGENLDVNVPESGLTELQVLYKDPYRIKVLVGKKVQVDGWLFHKDSDDQLTNVLIDAKKIKPAVVW